MLRSIRLLLVLLFSVLASASASPRILFQDRFDSAPLVGEPTVPPWRSKSLPSSEHSLRIERDLENLFGEGTANRFLAYRDPVATASLVLGATTRFSAEVITFSFLFREPADPEANGQLTIQFFAGNGAATTANRVQVFHFLEGAIRTAPNIPYLLDRTYRFDLVINNSENAVPYRDGRHVVGSGKADVWIDGELVRADFVHEREAATGAILGFDIRTFTSQRQRAFLDNVTVFEGAVVGAAFVPVAGEVSFPLVLEQNRELEELFGYDPDFLPNEISFDRYNRPCMRSRTADIDATGYVQTIRREGVWEERHFVEAIRNAFPTFQSIFRGAGWLGARVVFDVKDRMYTAVKIRLTDGSYRNLLLYSADHGKSFSAHDIGTGGDVALEHFTGNNPLPGPPFLVIQHRKVAEHDSTWADYHEMRVVQPRLENDSLVIPPHSWVTNSLISIGQHSGGSSFSATRYGKTHFAWIEVSDADVPGAPTYVATYDHATGTVGPKVLIAYSPPKNNSHNRPGVVLDSEGYIHVVTGSHHGENFFHTRSRQTGNAYAGWTTPEPVWNKGWRNSNGVGPERGGQTYVSLVCDGEDTLHLVFRHWRYADQYFFADPYYAALAYQRKPKNGAWSEPVPLVIPERGIYAIYYQKLSIDHRGRLFLSASYYDNTLLESPELGRYLRRMLLLSSDKGASWKLAETSDFAENSFFGPFEVWQRQSFDAAQLSDPSVSGPLAEPLGDGIPNLLKAAWGIGAFENGRAATPKPFLDADGRMAVEFWQSTNFADLLAVEWSSDLLEWSNAGVEKVLFETVGERQRVRFRLNKDAASAARTFLRIRVEE